MLSLASSISTTVLNLHLSFRPATRMFVSNLREKLRVVLPKTVRLISITGHGSDAVDTAQREIELWFK